MFLQSVLQKRLNDLNDEEDKFLSSTGAAVLVNKPSGSMLASSGASIIGGGLGGKTTIGSIRNGQVNFQKEHTFFSKQQHMFPKA